MGKFIIKHIDRRRPQVKIYDLKQIVSEDVVSDNKNISKAKNMTTSEKVAKVQEVLDSAPTTAKRLKKDKGLIEKTESSKIILTEDNKELLYG